MQKFHQITDRLWPHLMTKEAFDTIIVTELGKMAKEIRGASIGYAPQTVPGVRIDEILGLSSQQEPEPVEPRESCFCPLCNPKPKTAQEWCCPVCGNFKLDNFCGKDGTPRPKVKSLAEIIGEAIGEASMQWIPRPTGVFDSTNAAKLIDRTLAQINHFNSTKERAT